MFEFCRALQVSSLPRPIKTTLPGPMQLFSSTINASATPAIAVLDQPSSMESFMSMQPQLSAVYLRTTAAKRISTTEYQVRIFMMYTDSPKVSVYYSNMQLLFPIAQKLLSNHSTTN